MRLLILSIIMVAVLGQAGLAYDPQRTKNPEMDNPPWGGGLQGATVVNLANAWLSIRVDSMGLFTLWTTGGDPDNPNDDNKRLLYGTDPWSSYATLRINGSDHVFGSSGAQVSTPQVVGSGVQCQWNIAGLLVTEILEFVQGGRVGREDVLRIAYACRNDSGAPLQISLRLMLDTMLGNNDGAPFRVPGTGAVTTEMEYLASSADPAARVPEYWQSFDNLLSPTVVSQGTLRTAGIVWPDRFVLAAWPYIYSAPYAYQVTPGMSFGGDSAAAVYWGYESPFTLPPGGSIIFETYYGLGEMTYQPGDIGLAVTGPTALGVDNGGYSPDPFTVTAYVTNGDSRTRDITITLAPGADLYLAPGQSAAVTLPSIAPGRDGQVSWLVRPTTSAFDRNAIYAVTAESAGLDPARVERTVFLPGIRNKREALVLQAYPGDSNGSLLQQIGNAAGATDPIIAVPGVLRIDPGHVDRNGDGRIDPKTEAWSNFISAQAYSIKSVVLTKTEAEPAQCNWVYDGGTITQRGTAAIRTWWPLLYEAPGTKWELTIFYTLPGQLEVKKEVWTWTAEATLESVANLMFVFHSLPFGLSQVPLIGDDCVYAGLQDLWSQVRSAAQAQDLALAGSLLMDYEFAVVDRCVTMPPSTPMPCGPAGVIGVANTRENPACCKLLVDAEYVGFKFGLFTPKK